MTQAQQFRDVLAAQYRELFTTPEYATAAARMTPEALATRMTDGLISGAASKDGDGIKRTCKALGIKNTYAAIKTYLNG
jgi:hypothetical protein